MSKLRRLIPFLMLCVLILAYWPPQLIAQGSNQAALVVRLGDGNVQTRCVTFAEEQITGYELLLRSGLEVVAEAQGMGALVCGIGGVGCPADNCLCQCKGGGECIYWSYWHQNNGSWQYSQGGASMYPITHGMVDGWSWGPGAVNQAIAPPATSFDAVCQVPATATTTPEPTATAVPTAIPPTATPVPTNTPLPPPTPQPEISFSVDATTVNAGACTTLRWRVANITAVYLNEFGVIGEDTQQVCPQQTETYTLRIVHAGGEEIRSVTVTVLAAPPTPPPTPVPPAAESVGALSPTAVPPTSTAAATDTAVPTVPSPAPTVGPTETAAPATATPTTAWITVAPLPTRTAAAVEVAVLPPTPLSTVPPTPAANRTPAELATAVAWPPYALFLAIVLMLSLLVLRASRQAKTS